MPQKRSKKRKKVSALFLIIALMANVLNPLFTVPIFASDHPMHIEKTVDKSEVFIGEEFTYTIKYANPNTTDDGTNVLIEDNLPTGIQYVSFTPSNDVKTTSVNGNVITFNMGDLKAGKSGILKITAKFPAGSTMPTIGSVANSATIQNGAGEPVASNEVTVTPKFKAPDFNIIKTKLIPQGAAVLGQPVTYQITVTGNSAIGGLDLNSTVIVDTLPVGATYVSSEGGLYDSGTRTVTWNIGELKSGQTVSRKIKVLYPDTFFNIADTVTNNAVVSVIPLGSVTPITDTASVAHGFGPAAPGVGNFNKDGRQADDRYSVGQEAKFYLNHIENTGNIPLDKIEIIDDIPDKIAVTGISAGSYSDSCTVDVEYQLSSDLLTDWHAWGAIQSLPTLAVGDKITKVKWTITSLDGIAPGFHETAPIEIKGTVSGNPGEDIKNDATLTAYIGADPPIIDDASKTIHIIDPMPWILGEKSVKNNQVSFNMKDRVEYTLTVKNHEFATGNLDSPVIYEVLPLEMEDVQAVSINPVCTTSIVNIAGIDRTVLQWSFGGSLAPGASASVTFSAKIKDQTLAGTVHNDMYVASLVINNYENIFPDTFDGRKALKTTKDIFVRFTGSIDAQKWVKGELDQEWSYYGLLPGFGKTLPGGIADYRLVIKNSGSNGPISDLVLIDILPVIGDKGVIDTKPRDTAWRPILINQITGENGGMVPAGIKVYYSTSATPALQELSDPLNSYDTGWSETPPLDITTVKALKIKFDSLVLQPNQEVILEWPMRSPIGSPTNYIAWNSFGYGATYPDVNGQEAFLPSEPKKVGHMIQSYPGAAFRLGNYVWDDWNKNGIQDLGEPGINNVLVNLYHDGEASPFKYTRTGNDFNGNPGLYEFVNLPADNDYRVEFVYPKDYKVTPSLIGLDRNIDSNIAGAGKYDYTDMGILKDALKTSDIILIADDLSIDLGLYKVASVGDLVWDDKDTDGIQDPGEPGIQGVTVKLLNPDGSPATYGNGDPIANVVTDAQGNYLFQNLEPGNYKVQFVNPGGAYKFSSNNSTSENLDSDTENVALDGLTADSQVFSLKSGENYRDLDAGMYLAKIGNFVWHDLDADGIQDGGEPGISGVTVKLTDNLGAGVTDAYGIQVGDAVTDSNGSYIFKDLKAGSYIVQFIKPAGYDKYTKLDQGANDLADSDADRVDGRTGIINLAAGEINMTIDSGLYKYVTLGDLVWNDKDADGIKDSSETGIQNVTVKLLDNLGAAAKYENGVSVIDDITDASGNYLFTGLEPGKYMVQFINPDATKYVFSPLNQTSDASDSDAVPLLDQSSATTGVYTLASGDSDLTVDAGLHKGLLGDLVWEDRNGNGIQDTGEPGINNVLVELLDSLENKLDETHTDSNGKYEFNDLDGGSYKVKFNAPVNYYMTYADLGANDAIDSDASKATGITNVIVLTVGTVNKTIDAGMFRLTAIGDLVWNDKNANGRQDALEVGIEGVTVKLKNSAGIAVATNGLGNPVSDVVTDASGNYLFSNLEPGQYKVQFMNPDTDKYKFTPVNQGADDAIDSDAVIDALVLGKQVSATTAVYTLISGTPNLTVDAGLHKALLGDLVWEDQNGNGVQDALEPGIAGVTVELLDNGDNAIKTTTTNASGIYEFNDLDSGSYKVRFTPPANYYITLKDQGANDAKDSDADSVSRTTSTIVLAAAEENKTIDAGMYRFAEVGDFVWLDKDGDGLQDLGEPPIKDIKVTIFDSLGTKLGEVYTDSVGKYIFSNLMPGTYTISFETGSIYKLTQKNAGDDTKDSDIDLATKSVNVSLVSNESNMTVDAGLVIDAAIDIVKTVFFGHGALEPGVSQLAGQVGRAITYKFVVTNTGNTHLKNIKVVDNQLSIDDEDMTKVGTATSMAPGESITFYYQTNILGDLTNTAVVKALPSNAGGIAIPNAVEVTAQDSAEVIGIDPKIDIQKTVYAGPYVPLKAGEELVVGENGTDITYLFTVKNTGNTYLKDIVINDIDLNITKADMVKIAGNEALAPGESISYYYESEITKNLLNTAETSATPCNSSSVTLPDVTHPTDNDKAEVKKVVPGIKVVKTVYKGHDGGAQVGAETYVGKLNDNITYVFTIENTGNWSLKDIAINDATLGKTKANLVLKSGIEPLVPGGLLVYYYETTLTNNLVNRVEVEGTPCEDDGDTLENITVKPTWFDEAEVIIGGSIGDYVWNDSNANRIQEPSEIGIKDVKVILKNEAGTVISTTTTDIEGKYLFDDLMPMKYVVSIDKTTLPAGMEESYELDQVIDNKVLVDLKSGDAIRDVDFGYYTPTYEPIIILSTIGDQVWEDKNKNGIQEADELGIANVGVILKNSSGTVISSTTTDASGWYVFDKLLPGSFTVSIEKLSLTAGMLPTYELDGTLDNKVDIILTSGVNRLDVDFGYYSEAVVIPPKEETPPIKPIVPAAKNDASLGDYIWYDANGNGLQDPNEIAIPKVKLILTDSQGKSIVTTTDSAGRYIFDKLAAGTYTVSIDKSSLLKGLQSTYELDGILDSKVVVSLKESEIKDDVDFGFNFKGVNIEDDKLPEGSAIFPNDLPKTGNPYYNLLLLGIAIGVISLIVLQKSRGKG